MLLPKHKPVRSKKHRMFVASLPCCVTGSFQDVQACHIRTGNRSGMGYKSGDDCCVPMTKEIHALQHGIGSEKKFWGDRLERAKELASALFLKTGQRAECLKLIERFRRNG